MPYPILLLIGVAAGLVIILALSHISVWLSNWYFKQEKEEDEHTGQNYEDGGDDSNHSLLAAVAIHIEAIGNQIKSQNKKQERHEKQRDRLEVIGVFAAIFAVIFAGYSAWVFQKQLWDMDADQRPWIKVTIQPAEFKWHPMWGGHPSPQEEVTSTPALILKNIGRSPAFNVQGVALAYIDNPLEARARAQQRICSWMGAQTPEAGYGRTLFPTDEFDAARANGFGVLGLGFSASDVDKYGTASTEGKTLFFYIIGCADYTFSKGGIHHQTLFSYFVHREEKRAQPELPVITGFGVDKDVPADEVVLVPSPDGNTAN